MANLGTVTVNNPGEATIVVRLSRRYSLRIAIARGLLKLTAWVLKFGYRESTDG